MPPEVYCPCCRITTALDDALASGTRENVRAAMAAWKEFVEGMWDPDKRVDLIAGLAGCATHSAEGAYRTWAEEATAKRKQLLERQMRVVAAMAMTMALMDGGI